MNNLIQIGRRHILRVAALALVACLTAIIMPASPASAATVEMTACQHDYPSHAAWCDPMETAAHRCVMDANENTLLSFMLVGSRGIRCETDVRALKDGTLVILHDGTIGRTVDPASVPAGVSTNASVSKLTLAQWRQLRTKDPVNPQPLPTLEEWMEAAGTNGWETMLQIKVKLTSTQLATVLNLMNTYDPYRSYVWFFEEPAKKSDGSCNLDTSKQLLALGLPTGINYPGGSSPCRLPSVSSMASSGYLFLHNAQRSSSLATLVAQGDYYGLMIGAGGANTSKSSWAKFLKAHTDMIMGDNPMAMDDWFHAAVEYTA